MPRHRQAVLAHLVDIYEATSDPQAPEAIAEDLDYATAHVVAVLDALQQSGLVAAVEGDVRPTTTARQLSRQGLLEEEFLVLDVEDDEW